MDAKLYDTGVCWTHFRDSEEQWRGFQACNR